MPVNDALATWTDDSVWRSGPAAWRALRTLRASPPGAARKGERAQVFRAALEQAQQQLTAAGTVGYESRPLNLFYGLSQAGRAVAAAAVGLADTYPAGVTPGQSEAPTPWELKGHGITVNTDGITPSTFPAMTVAPDRTKTGPARLRQSGSFVRLARLLSPGCDVTAGVALRRLWASVLEAVKSQPLENKSASVLTISLEQPKGGRPPAATARPPAATAQGRAYIGTRLAKASGSISQERALEFLADYPTLAGAGVYECCDGYPPQWEPGIQQFFTSSVFRCSHPVGPPLCSTASLTPSLRTTGGAAWCSLGSARPTPSPCTPC